MDNLDVPADLPTESPFAAGRTPRLSILHLMLWTLCSAVYLTIYRALLSLQGEGPAGYAGIQDASSVINGIVSGAVFGGTIVLVGTRVRTGPPMLRQPGHWLLCVAALQSSCYLPVVAGMLLVHHVGNNQMWWTMFAYAAVMGISPLGFILAAWHQRTLRWKILFLLLATASTGLCLIYAAIAISALGANYAGASRWVQSSLSISHWATPLLAAVVVTISIGESALGKRRDWLHWTGTATHFAATLVNLLWMVAAWFIR